MKKTFALMMAIALLVAAVVPAYAVNSPHTDVPVKIHGSELCPGCWIELWKDRNKLPEEKREAFEAAWDCLKEAVPEGFACRLFTYHIIEDEGHEACTFLMVMNGSKNEAAANEIHVQHQNNEELCATYLVDMSIEGVTEVAAKEFVENEWVDLKLSFEGGNIVLYGVHDAPFALFMK